MTLDELIGVYIEASNAVVWEAEKRGLCPMTLDMQRAGVTAIVRALRDETRHMTLNRDGLEELFTQILGIAAEEKVAEGIAERADEQRADAPATDPIRDAAPAVCVWTGEEYVTYSTSCESEHEVDPHKAPPTYCPSCGKPITFKEANHG